MEIWLQVYLDRWLDVDINMLARLDTMLKNEKAVCELSVNFTRALASSLVTKLMVTFRFNTAHKAELKGD
jgi:hypothetical protein